MKKQLLHLSAFLLALFLMSSCFFLGPSIKGNGIVTTEYREIGEFDKIKVSTGLKVMLVQSEKNLVKVVADENLHEVIRTELKRGELTVFADARIKKSRELLVTVEFTNLEELRSTAGAQVGSDGMLRIKRLVTKASAGSQQKLQLHTQTLEAKASAGSQIRLSGESREASLTASSGAQLNAEKLDVRQCKADVSSGAHIYVEVSEDFEGEASSGGQIYYSGSPSTVDTSTSSGGNISKK
ncbi:head GIN domain-containing protein [uncultured Sunxiuqinia sp.]|uniref:head GIN domain-containing protein n=1 Tax=uncultured Sunxiuqinia sp. TaxID=1573825 RepID=UPI00261F9FDD|nr:head GIN domain-containing protein [uncultured Sunxiuqinia sp.]